MQPKGVTTFGWGVNATGMLRTAWVAVKPCDPIVTHGPYLSAL